MNKKLLALLVLGVIGLMAVGLIFYLQNNRQTTNTKAAEIQPTSGMDQVVETIPGQDAERKEVERINFLDNTPNGQVKSPFEDCSMQAPPADHVREDDNWQPPC